VFPCCSVRCREGRGTRARLAGARVGSELGVASDAASASPGTRLRDVHALGGSLQLVDVLWSSSALRSGSETQRPCQPGTDPLPAELSASSLPKRLWESTPWIFPECRDLLLSFQGTEGHGFFFLPQSAPLGGTATTANGRASARTGACVTLPRGCATARLASSAPTAVSVSAGSAGGSLSSRSSLSGRGTEVGANPARSRVADAAGEELRGLAPTLAQKNLLVSPCSPALPAMPSPPRSGGCGRAASLPLGLRSQLTSFAACLNPRKHFSCTKFYAKMIAPPRRACAAASAWREALRPAIPRCLAARNAPLRQQKEAEKLRRTAGSRQGCSPSSPRAPWLCARAVAEAVLWGGRGSSRSSSRQDVLLVATARTALGCAPAVTALAATPSPETAFAPRDARVPPASKVGAACRVGRQRARRAVSWERSGVGSDLLALRPLPVRGCS